MSIVSDPNDSKQTESKKNSNAVCLLRSTSAVTKRNVNVLDEDTFIQKLEGIIERDFFPDLEKLKLQQAYYEAVKTNDLESLRDLYSKYNSLISRSTRQTPNSTPAFFDTPSNELLKERQSKDETPYANKEPPTNLKEISLDKFLANNTSEDNLSFEVLMKDSEKKAKTKLHQSWLFEKEMLHLKNNEEALKLENGRTGDESVIKALDTWTYTSKNTLMYIPEGVPLTNEEQLEKIKSIRKINYSNTRFNSDTLDALKRNSSIQNQTPNTKSVFGINAISKIGVDGKETQPKETPKVKGYSFVDASPSPMPGRSMGDESPMMTWGEIESTPFRLEGSATPYFGQKLQGAPEFKIPDVPEREKLAFNLEEKASAARRKKKNDALKFVQRNLASPSRNLSSNSISEKINSMSPAAQRLLSSKISLKSDKTSSFSTPSPLITKSTPSPYRSLVTSPLIKNTSNQSIDNLRLNLKRSMNDSSLTDNLLKLPKNV